MTSADVLRRVLARFPPVTFAMAYGSAVFKQLNHNTGAAMVDYVLAVRGSEQWHADNMQRNARDYSAMRLAGPRALSAFQRWGGGRLLYNTLVPVEIEGGGRMVMKYGVIEEADLVRDLHEWSTLYVSGRMHKPVRVLQSESADVRHAAHLNLRHALHVALLLLPRHFTTTELYMTIAELSYTGDFRMRVGEHPDKVSNIVHANLPHFHALYLPVLQGCALLECTPLPPRESGPALAVIDARGLPRSAAEAAAAAPDATVEQDVCVAARRQLLHTLPHTLRERLADITGGSDLAHLAEPLANADPRALCAVRAAVAGIVAPRAKEQAVKGVLSAGAIKSARYAWEKVQKRRAAVAGR